MWPNDRASGDVAARYESQIPSFSSYLRLEWAALPRKSLYANYTLTNDEHDEIQRHVLYHKYRSCRIVEGLEIRIQFIVFIIVSLLEGLAWVRKYD